MIWLSVPIYTFLRSFLAALGTYLIRAVPFFTQAKKGKKRENPPINLFFRDGPQ
ncbi:MAG: hypothetical protein CM1200mP28_15600 [Deltaproteobacteria bacterium]|nr:MAG: hypothetical protein CM1200mP28_15600 [Deltaproteobacteria bacterium]